MDHLTTLPCERRVAPGPGTPYPVGRNDKAYDIFPSGLLLHPKNVVGSAHVDPVPRLPCEKTLPFTGRTVQHLIPLDELSRLPNIPTRAALRG